MNPAQARQFIKETFTQAFDKGRFRNFAINLLNHVDEGKKQPMAVPAAFAAHVKSCQRLATYADPQGELMDILVVHLTEDYKIERTRTALRDFVAHKLKRGDSYKEGALAAFVPPTLERWRLSYVRMQYESVRDPKTGFIKPEEKATPARRFSYLVGEGESCHTAQTRFLGLLQDTATDPTLAQIEEAFSVEAVTKEFFKKYAELFGHINASLDKLVARDKSIRDEFAVKGVNTVNFAKKLMGQIVFLQFLQKKGWLGVEKGMAWGSGPRNFLRLLADQSALSDKSDASNFFNDVLEPLFYDTLATDRGHEAWCDRFNCRIPFLNGGLFEPPDDYDWRKTEILLPNELFTNTKFVEEGITGTGVLDVFDRYNFTVNEAEPLEKEVAIDPEMLGKVFENLIEENRRKGLGSFYTPREIVHYMCQESLINYLDTAINSAEEALAPGKPRQIRLLGEPEPYQPSLKIQARREIVPRADIETFIHLGEQISHYEAVEAKYAIKMPKSIKENARVLDGALASITVCDPAVGSGAFPVGMMAEIVRARCALTPYFNDIAERTPYHFKRHAIQNCLYGVDIDPSAVEIAKLRLWLSLVVDEEDVKQIKPLPNLDYKVVCGNSLLGFPYKSKRVEKIEALKKSFFNETDASKKRALKKEIDAAIAAAFDDARASIGYKANFDFEIYFSEVFRANKGFDVVIANPPYVRQEAIKELKPALKSAGYECFSGTADLLVYFYERGVKLLRQGGTIALITSNKYYRAGYGEKLRGFLARELTLHRLIDFGDAPVFDAIAYASILTGARSAPARGASALAYTWEKEMAFERIAEIVPQRGQQLLQSELKSDGWRLESPAVLRLLEKLRHTGKPLGEYVNGRFYRGILTGLNEAFVVDRATLDRLIREHKSSAEILRPFLRGRDVKRWRTEFAGQYLIKIESSENKGHPWSGKSEKEAEKIFAATYPAIHTWLEEFRPALKKRDDQGKYFWELRSCVYWREFEQPKIVIPAIANDVAYAADYAKHFSNDKTSICVTNEPNYMLGLLNSRVLWWLIQQTAASKQGGFYEFKPMYVSAIPIPAVPSEKQKPVERLVERILSAKQLDAGADVSALEREIDELVYALYGLTPDEIKIVERSS